MLPTIEVGSFWTHKERGFEVEVRLVAGMFVHAQGSGAHVLRKSEFWRKFEPRPDTACSACVGCGACCVGMKVAVENDEAERVTRALSLLMGRPVELGVMHVVRQIGWHNKRTARLSLPMVGEDPERCIALVDKSCGIYGDRPILCKAFIPGDGGCQGARVRAGLLPLEPHQYQRQERKSDRRERLRRRKWRRQ